VNKNIHLTEDMMPTMLRLIEELSIMNLPIIFKGAVVLKNVLNKYTFDTE